MALGNLFGYDTYMICGEGFRNVEEGGAVVGFVLQLRIANYRGYLLSQIEDIRVSVDGVAVARSDIRFRIGGKTYTLDEMETVIDNRWELLQTAEVTCLKRGGLRVGEHEVRVEEHIRPSYIPITAVAYATKRLLLETTPTAG